MSELRVEAATGEDWPAIRSLMARSPMRGALPITLVRGNPMHAAYPHWGAEQHALVARRDRTLVGYLHCSQQMRRVGEAVAPVIYCGDLRVEPGQRRNGVARALIGTALAQKADQAYGLAYVNADNLPMLRALEATGGMRVHAAGAFRTHVMLSLPKSPHARSFQRMVPNKRACEELSACWAERHLGVVLDAQTLQSALAAHPAIHFYARTETPEHAAFAVWDMRPLRDLGLSPAPRWFQAVRLLWRIAAHTGRTHPLPPAPQAWHGADVVCCGRPLDAAALAHARHVAFTLGCHTLNLVSGANEQSAGRVPSLGISLETQVMLLTHAKQAAPPMPVRPLAVDLRVV